MEHLRSVVEQIRGCRVLVIGDVMLDEYVRGDAHVNTAESFFALLKRGVYGNFHAVSEKHLQRYVNEAAFKWNNRVKLGIDDTTRANNAIRGAAGKRLMYRQPNSTVRVG